MYVFQLKEKDHFKILSVFHILMALTFIFDFTYSDKKTKEDWLFAIVYAAVAALLLLAGFLPRKLIKFFSRHLALLLFESVMLMGGAIYFWSRGASFIAASHVLLSGVIILAWIYLRKRTDGEKIVISEKHIILPGLFVYRIILWSELQNLVKKYDLLTIDFKNNKLLQTEIIHDESIDEISFNQFCKEQLLTHNK